jgi:glucose-6-phosphate 1-epimerase
MAHDPCRLRESVGGDGARLAGYAHGGHLTGWWPPGHDDSVLWMSPTTRCASPVAIRGGVPVVFPQFGSLGPLRKHGLVRDVAWDVLGSGAGPDEVVGEDDSGAAVFVAGTDVGPTEAWPNEARLTLTARATGTRLIVRLDVHNTGPSPLHFTAALHTYLAVGQRGSRVTGLDGMLATNALADREQTLLSDALPTDAAMDLMVRDVGDRPVTVAEPSGPAVTMTATGFTDRVVWNPGAGHTLPDVPPGHEAGFVCVEPAVLAPVPLDPQQRWSGTMDLQWYRHA